MGEQTNTDEEETTSLNDAPSATETDESDAELDFSHEEIPPEEEVVDRSNDPDAEEKALQLKDEGNGFLKEGKFLEAVKKYSDALEYRPTNAIILCNRALAFIKLENYGLALVGIWCQIGF